MFFFGKVEDRKYLEWIRKNPCCFDGCNHVPPSEPHHIRGIDGLPGTSRKPSDHLALPACRTHHDLYQKNKGRMDQAEIMRAIVYHLSLYLLEIGEKNGRRSQRRINPQSNGANALVERCITII